MKFFSLWPYAKTGALALAALAGGARADPPPLKVEEIPSPAAVEGAAAPVFASEPGGAVWMAWAEPGADGGRALKCAQFGSDSQWKTPKMVAHGKDFAISGEDPPALACGPDGDLAAAWPETGRTVKFSLSHNHGETWSPPAVLSKESSDITQPTICVLQGGDPLAVWLDGRKKDPTAPLRAKLYTRFLAGDLTAAADWLIAADAAPGCQPEIKPLLDGGAVVGYRAIDSDGHAVGRMVRLHARRWKLENPVSPDTWVPAQPSTETIRFAVDGGRVGAVWFTDATKSGSGKISGSYSPDAGARFLLPTAVAEGAALAKPDVALLHDGAMVAVWLEGSRGDDGAGGAILRLRRLTPELYKDEETKLGADAAWVSGQPRIALVKDYAGDANSAQLLVAFTSAGDDPDIHTLLITVPEGDLLAAAAEDCHCAPSPTQLLGYPMRGVVKGLDGDRNTLKLEIDAVPGVMDAGEHEFKATAGLLQSVRIGSSVIARIDRDGKDWTIFEVHQLH